jgi:hypothetical protein
MDLKEKGWGGFGICTEADESICGSVEGPMADFEISRPSERLLTAQEGPLSVASSWI